MTQFVVYPELDDTLNFPPLVRQAIADSPEMEAKYATQTDLQAYIDPTEVSALLESKMDASIKGQPLGVAGLDVGGKVVETQLPDRLSSTSLTTSYVWVDPGVLPDTGADVTTQIKAAFVGASGKPVRLYKPGVYLVDTLVLDQPGALVVGSGVILKLKPNATGITGVTSVLSITSSNVSLRIEGVLDGNRAGQNISAFNTAGGTNTRVMPGVRVLGTSISPLTNVNVYAAEIKNTVDFALRAAYVSNSFFAVSGHDCGCGAVITDFDNITVPNLTFYALDNLGAKAFPHAVDLFRGGNSRFGIISSQGQYGNGTVAAGTTLSDWISGATLTNVKNTSIDQLAMVSSTDVTQNKGVGVSLLDCQFLKVGSLEVSGYSDLCLEQAGVTNSHFAAIDLDGRYVGQSGTGSNLGWVLGNYGYYPDTKSRSQRFTENNTYTSFTVRRFTGEGIDIRAGRNNEFVNGKVFGNRRGLRVRWLPIDTDENFNPQIVRDLEGNRFTNCDFSYNEEHGVEYQDGANPSFLNCRFNNNGQAFSHPSGTTRNGNTPQTNLSGLYFKSTTTSGLSKTGVRVTLPEASDTQTFSGALSGTTATGKTLSARNPNLYSTGQTIKLVGAGASGADLITRIQSVTQDEVVIEDSITTYTNVAGTGTISTSGTAVTGVGTLFTTELNARYWITVGGVSRQIIKMASDTAATLGVAFPTNLVGAAFVIEKITVTGLPSQKFGIYYSADTIAPQQIGGLHLGNTTQGVNDVTVAGQGTRLRLTSVPGQTTIWSNSWATDGMVRATDSTAAGKTVIGGLGPASQAGIGAGGAINNSAIDTSIYRQAAGVWRTDHVMQHGNQASSPAAPATGVVPFSRLNASSKTEYCVRFPTGVVIIMATEP
jgi:parallel beta-helix repeat protein